MKPTQFFNNDQDVLKDSKVINVLKLIEKCTIQLQLPDTLDTQLKVQCTTNEQGILVVFSLYLVSDNLPNSTFSIFELCAFYIYDKVKYLLYSHQRQHSLQDFNDLHDLIEEIINKFDYSGILNKLSANSSVVKRNSQKVKIQSEMTKKISSDFGVKVETPRWVASRNIGKVPVYSRKPITVLVKELFPNLKITRIKNGVINAQDPLGRRIRLAILNDRTGNVKLSPKTQRDYSLIKEQEFSKRSNDIRYVQGKRKGKSNWIF